MYIGTTEQNKRSRISYKNRKLKANPKEQWNVVENTHPAIIDKKVFDMVQKMVIVQSYNRNEKKNTFLLDGLLFCYECHHKIGVRGKKNGHYYMVCNNYRRNSKIKLCTSHGFSYKALEKDILQYIRNLFLAIDSKKIELNIKNNRKKQDFGKMLKQLQTKIDITKDNIDKMYIDKLNNKISEEMYNRLFNKLADEVRQKEKQYNKLKIKEDSGQDDSKEIEKIIKEFLSLEKPNPEFMKVIINRIEIHQDKQVDIIFNFKKSQIVSKSRGKNLQ